MARATTIRFSGLSSGIDTEAIVTAMMTSYQSRIDKVNKNTTLAEWKKESYKELSNKINNFKTGALSTLKSANFNKSNVNMSQEGTIQVKTNGSTQDGTHRVDVKEIAEAATVKTKTINYDKSTKLVSDIAGMPDSGIIKVNGKEVQFDNTTTMEQLANSISSELDNGTCKFDESVGAFIITSNNTGASQSISFEGTDEAILQAMGIEKSDTNNYTYSGKNAKVIYNGGLTIESETNDIKVNGLEFTAVGPTNGTVTVSISKDVDAMVETVSKFVKEYNDLLSEMTKLLNADSAKGYEPLTDDEKDAMTEKEIELWENKIKGSLLRKDSGLSDLTSLFRSTMSSNYAQSADNPNGLTSEYTMLSQIGISSKSWSDQGKLTVNEEKLKEALTTDGDAVATLLTTMANNLEQELTKRSSSTELRSYGQYFSDKTLTSKISQYAKDLEKAQTRYDLKEAALYKKFTAMETAMNNMNSQSSLFASL